MTYNLRASSDHQFVRVTEGCDRRACIISLQLTQQLNIGVIPVRLGLHSIIHGLRGTFDRRHEIDPSTDHWQHQYR